VKGHAFVIGMICVVMLAGGAADGESLDRLNVMDFGAKGDGKADDTAAVMKAIEAGAKKKLPVCFPRGEYRITKPLSISNQSLTGASR